MLRYTALIGGGHLGVVSPVSRGSLDVDISSRRREVHAEGHLVVDIRLEVSGIALTLRL